MTDHLYGAADAERLWDDPATVYESEFEEYLDPESKPWKPCVIEEWSAKSVGEVVTDGATVAERVLEWLYDDYGFDGMPDKFRDAAADPEVVAAFDAAVQLFASKCGGYRFADTRLRTLTVTWDDNDEPLLDGVPMYREKGS